MFYFIDIIVVPLICSFTISCIVKRTYKIDKEFPIIALLFLFVNSFLWLLTKFIDYSNSVSNTDYMNLMDDISIDLIVTLFLVVLVSKKNITNIEKIPTKRVAIIVVVFLLATFLNSVARWFVSNFAFVTFESILFTIAAPAKGTSKAMLLDAIYMMATPLLAVIFMLLLWKVLRKKQFENNKSILARFNHISTKIWLPIVLFLIMNIALIVWRSGIVEYIINAKERSTIYEEYYVDPSKVNISGDENRNLIMIFLESMETTYMDRDNGGIHEVNYIPGLTDLAQNNISFSNLQSGIGGFTSCKGTDWTMGATIASTSGINFEFPEGEHTMNKHDSIAKNATFLGDILENFGYNSEVVMGTDGEYAGEGMYFEQHGNNKVFDLNKMYEENYIEKGYYEWWGIRDEIVYSAAKDELVNLSKEDKPFALTMFTMDTHCSGGYKCPLCKNTYDGNLENVLECADRQINDFVAWCKEQEFFKNTTIVIIGDHPRMDSFLIGGMDISDRKVYNCFINSLKKPYNANNRAFTTLDIFPTIISAMGYEIEGNRLGLGVDLFSDSQTLAEQYGIEWLNDELSKKSSYYMTHFY